MLRKRGTRLATLKMGNFSSILPTSCPARDATPEKIKVVRISSDTAPELWSGVGIGRCVQVHGFKADRVRHRGDF